MCTAIWPSPMIGDFIEATFNVCLYVCQCMFSFVCVYVYLSVHMPTQVSINAIQQVGSQIHLHRHAAAHVCTCVCESASSHICAQV